MAYIHADELIDGFREFQEKQEDYLDSKIEAATETWKDVGTDEFMNELRQSDNDKAREEAKESLKLQFLMDTEVIRDPRAAIAFGWHFGFDKGVAFAEPRWTAVSDGLPSKPGNYFITYFAPLTNSEEVGSLYWDGHVWEFPFNRRGEIFLTIIAWTEMPAKYRQPYTAELQKEAK